MNIGYGRVSTDKQDATAQENELIKAGCAKDKILLDTVSGSAAHKPELKRALEQLREGDTLVVWKLDRLSRSLKDLLFTMEKISVAKAKFKSVTEAVDTSKAGGRALMQMLGVFAEFERSMIRERTKLGLDAARAEGRIGGRRHILSEHNRKEAVRMVNAGEKTQAQVARNYRVHRSVISRLVSQDRVAAEI